MRLLTYLANHDRAKLITFDDDDYPPYAILSHTWNHGQEITFKQLSEAGILDKSGYRKIRFCMRQAANDGIDYCWIDTCFIDKSTSEELSTAINSMYRWYKRAKKCYVFLADVLLDNARSDSELDLQAHRELWILKFRQSRWFTRGWTLQELLAPAEVEFYSASEQFLGTRESLRQEISAITGIPVGALRGQSLSDFSVEERMRWASTRVTTLKEDKMYCLFGIFDVYLPLIYGEGDNAKLRLMDEIDKNAARHHKASNIKQIESKAEVKITPSRKRKRSDTIPHKPKRPKNPRSTTIAIPDELPPSFRLAQRNRLTSQQVTNLIHDPSLGQADLQGQHQTRRIKAFDDPVFCYGDGMIPSVIYADACIKAKASPNALWTSLKGLVDHATPGILAGYKMYQPHPDLGLADSSTIVHTGSPEDQIEGLIIFGFHPSQSLNLIMYQCDYEEDVRAPVTVRLDIGKVRVQANLRVWSPEQQNLLVPYKTPWNVADIVKTDFYARNYLLVADEEAELEALLDTDDKNHWNRKSGDL